MSFTSAVQPVPSLIPDGLFSQSVEGPSAPGGAGVSCERRDCDSKDVCRGAPMDNELDTHQVLRILHMFNTLTT